MPATITAGRSRLISPGSVEIVRDGDFFAASVTQSHHRLSRASIERLIRAGPVFLACFSAAYHMPATQRGERTLNLLTEMGANIDPRELRELLLTRIGRGQADGRSKGKFYLPGGGSECRIALTFHEKEKKIVAIERGPAFDDAEWHQIRKFLLEVDRKVGRDYSFSKHRVSGSWRGHRSGVQILPAPDNAPSDEGAENPFILEFPVEASEFWPLTNYRCRREHRELTCLLNILLAGHVSFQSERSQSFWAAIYAGEGNEPNIRWVQQYYFASLEEVITSELSPSSSRRIEEIEPDQYYGKIGLDGRGSRVPTDLDDLICRYQQLSEVNRCKFNRAAFWMYQSIRVWTISASSSFAAVVSAVEALTDRKVGPGPTWRFHNFFETYARGASLKKRREKMYELRSDIFHGSGLMELDQGGYFGWDPPGWNERELNEELRSLTRLAIRTWLLNPPSQS
jgi:hypothetical protein